VTVCTDIICFNNDITCIIEGGGDNLIK
jgi:hypothetical protein